VTTALQVVSLTLSIIEEQIKNAKLVDGANFVKGIGKITDITSVMDPIFRTASWVKFLFSIEKATNKQYSMQDRTEGGIEASLNSISLLSVSSIGALPGIVYSVAAYDKESTIALNSKMIDAFSHNEENFSNTVYGKNATNYYQKHGVPNSAFMAWKIKKSIFELIGVKFSDPQPPKNKPYKR